MFVLFIYYYYLVIIVIIIIIFVSDYLLFGHCDLSFAKVVFVCIF